MGNLLSPGIPKKQETRAPLRFRGHNMLYNNTSLSREAMAEPVQPDLVLLPPCRQP